MAQKSSDVGHCVSCGVLMNGALTPQNPLGYAECSICRQDYGLPTDKELDRQRIKKEKEVAAEILEYTREYRKLALQAILQNPNAMDMKPKDIACRALDCAEQMVGQTMARHKLKEILEN